MDFFIKKNATLPLIKLQVAKDGRNDFDSFMKLIELSAIFFSMTDVATGIPKINTRPAGFVEKTFINPDTGPEYYIYYQFTNKDTNRVGRYEGQFLLRSDDGTLILPIREKLYINIQDSFIGDDLPYESCYVSEFPCCVNPLPVTTTTTTTPTNTPTPTTSSLPIFETMIETVVSSGSVIIDFYVTLPHIINDEYTCDITKSFNVAIGNPIIVNCVVTIPSGDITGTARVTLDDDCNRIAEGHQTLSVIQNSDSLNVRYSKIETEPTYNFQPKPNPNISPTPTLTPTITPSITPTPTLTPIDPDLTIYYGKLESLTIDNMDINNLDILLTKSIRGKYLSYGMVQGFCYLVVPEVINQPTMFKNSIDGCNGFTVPFTRLDNIIVTDYNGNNNLYYVYRSFVSTNSNVDVWVCE